MSNMLLYLVGDCRTGGRGNLWTT